MIDREQFIRVTGIDRATVEEPHVISVLSESRDQLLTEQGMYSATSVGVAVFPVPMAQTGS